jgi:hypothetical protein
MEAAGGPPQQGKRRSSDVVFYGRQPGQVIRGHAELDSTIHTDGWSGYDDLVDLCYT